MFDWDAYRRRTQWFTHDRFGMFIHWGLYAIPARGEWIRNQERITVEDLARELSVSASYLSRLFKQETGESISAYIRSRKIMVAENLLKYTDHSMIEIANQLSFSSESHFIQQFREVVGMTPKKYRDENYLIQWDDGLK